MYEEFYGFKEKPFSIVPDPSFLYLSSKHRQALTYLKYGLTDKIGFILLTGEIGAGKTTIIKHLLTKINNNFETAVVFNTNVSPKQLLELILDEFEVNIPATGGKVAYLARLNQFLIERYAQDRQALLILDEAQNLSQKTLEEVRMISNLHTGKDGLIQVVLVGQPELRKKLQNPSLIQLSQRIAVSYHLASLSLKETKEYIEHRLMKAGAKSDYQPFSDEAIGQVFHHSGGIPRTINILCDAALVYAYADTMKNIEGHVIDHVVKDKQELGIFPSVNVDYKYQADEEKIINTDNLCERIENLESSVNKLNAIINRHLQEQGQREESYKDMLIQRFERILVEERKRADSFLIKYNLLKSKLIQKK